MYALYSTLENRYTVVYLPKSRAWTSRNIKSTMENSHYGWMFDDHEEHSGRYTLLVESFDSYEDLINLVPEHLL